MKASELTAEKRRLILAYIENLNDDEHGQVTLCEIIRALDNDPFHNDWILEASFTRLHDYISERLKYIKPNETVMNHINCYCRSEAA